MNHSQDGDLHLNRRGFLKATGGGLSVAGLAATTAAEASARPLTEKEKLARMASNSWPIRYIFKTRGGGGGRNPRNEEMKKKYGELTMLDFPQFTKDTFPGVTHMDIFSGLFGDVTEIGGAQHRIPGADFGDRDQRYYRQGYESADCAAGGT